MCLLAAGAILAGGSGVRAIDALAPVHERTGVVRATERDERIGRRGRRVVDHLVLGDLDRGGTFRVNNRALFDEVGAGDPITIGTSRLTGEPAQVRGLGFDVDLASGGWFWTLVVLFATMGSAMVALGAVELWTSRERGPARRAVLGLAPLGVAAGGFVGVAMATSGSEVDVDARVMTASTSPPVLVPQGGTATTEGWTITVTADPTVLGEHVVDVQLGYDGAEPAFPALLGLVLVTPNGARYPADLLDCDAPGALRLAREVQPGDEVAGAVCFPSPHRDTDVHLEAGGVELALEAR